MRRRWCQRGWPLVMIDRPSVVKGYELGVFVRVVGDVEVNGA